MSRRPAPPPTCKRCGAEIAWAQLVPSGARVPLDVSPDPDAGIYLRSYFTGPDGRPRSQVIRPVGAELAEARDTARRNPANRLARLWVDHRQSCTAR